MPAISSTSPGSCLPGRGLHHRADVFRRITASVLIGQIKKNHSSRTATVPPRGCRVKQTVLCLFTMSKDPVADTSQCQHNQTCSLACDVFWSSGASPRSPQMIGTIIEEAPTGQPGWRSQFFRRKNWWSQTGSNRRHPACKAGALPAELWPHFFAFSHRGPKENSLQNSKRMVGPGRLELPTSRLSGVRSNHLSYGPSGTPRDPPARSGERTLTRNLRRL
jgi:hypothetical protein